MTIRGLVLGLAMGVAASLLPAASATAYVPTGLWATRVVQVYSSAPDDVWHVNQAITRWNKESPVQMVRVYAPCSGCISVREATEPLAPLDDPDWTGVTYAYASGGVMSECLILLRPDPTRLIQDIDLAISTHELGHCLGLGHSNAKWSIMGTYADMMIRPRAHDFKKLAALYP